MAFSWKKAKKREIIRSIREINNIEKLGETTRVNKLKEHIKRLKDGL